MFRKFIVKLVFIVSVLVSCASMKSFYTNSKEQIISTKNDFYINVLILKTKDKVKISAAKPLFVKDQQIDAAKEYNVVLKNDKICINNYIIGTAVIEIFNDDELIKINNKPYRGKILLSKEDNNLIVINRVTLEKYLYGVLPAEVSPKWHKEVLKSQAVAARSFALYNKLNTKNLYDLSDCVFSQVYSGYSSETRETNSAIDETAGEVLVFNDEIIQAFFHANSGGKTEAAEDVWGRKLDYLKSIDDPYSIDQKNYKWSFAISFKDLTQKLIKNNVITDNIYDIKILNRTKSGRIEKMKIYTFKESVEIKGNNFRNYIGVDKIKSTNFSLQIKGDKVYFDGFGYGHGVGMSQEGAKKMAEIGKNYRDILNFYYRGTSIKRIY